MSAPALNSIGLADANTSARISPESVTARQTFCSASATSGEIEFAGGRSNQAIASEPRVSSFTGLSSQPVSGRAYGKNPCPVLTPKRPCATSRRRIVGGAKSSPHSVAACSSLASTSSSPIWSARANGGGMTPAPNIIPRSMSFSAAMPSSSTRQLSTSALSVKRSTSAVLSMSAAVLIEPLPGLGAEVAGSDQLLHLLVDEEPVAVGLLQVLGDVQHGVEAKQIDEEERAHRRGLRLRDDPVELL